MPGRGLLTVACLVVIALGCISVVRKLERERGLLRKLRVRGAIDPSTALALDNLSEDERDVSLSLARSGVLTILQNRCYLKSAQLRDFRRKRVRLALSGALGALVLCVIVAAVILGR